ncbi:MAG TPA: hypothetical protein VNJ02_02980 [Vicinamibacterales bacterium]|nr:hypothetical protein [Vicinamibacterales bacterium]
MGSKNTSKDDCFAQFDEAFASLEAELDNVPPPNGDGAWRNDRVTPTTAATPILTLVRPQGTAASHGSTQAQPNLDEYVDAFDQLDAQLAQYTPGVVRGNQAAHHQIAEGAPELLRSGVIASRGEKAAEIANPEPATTAATATPAPAPALISSHPVAATNWRQRDAGGTPLERLFGTLQNLSIIQDGINNRGARGTERLNRESIASVFAEVRELCCEFELETARVRVDFAVAALEDETLATLGQDVSELVRHIRHDLQSCSIWPIARNRVWSFGLSLGETTAAAFPVARIELEEGGRCFGFGRYTAAVFHLLRAADAGVRALATAADVKKGANPAADWKTLMTIVEARVATIERWPSGVDRTNALTFFSGAVAEVRTLQDASYKLALGASSFEEHEALHVCNTTKALLTRLAARIRPAAPRTLGKREFSK